MKKSNTAKPGANQDMPTIKSIGMHKVADNLWSVLTITTVGNEVVNVSMSEPNLREITISELKIAVMKQLIDETVDL